MVCAIEGDATGIMLAKRFSSASRQVAAAATEFLSSEWIVVAAASSCRPGLIFKCRGLIFCQLPSSVIPNCQYDATGIILAMGYCDASGITSEQPLVSRKVECREPDIGGFRVCGIEQVITVGGHDGSGDSVEQRGLVS